MGPTALQVQTWGWLLAALAPESDGWVRASDSLIAPHFLLQVTEVCSLLTNLPQNKAGHVERSRTSLGRCQKRASSGAAPGIPGAFGWRTRARRETGRRVLRGRPALGQEKALLPPRGEEERRTLVRGLLGRLGVEVGFVGWSDTAVRELGGLALETKAGWGMPLYSFRERNGRRRLFFFFF